MINGIGVCFQQNGKVFHYNALDLNPKVGDYIVAETEHGIDFGEVVQGIQVLSEEQLKTNLPKLVRIATEQDIKKATDNRKKEKEAFGIAQQKIKEHKLEMKLVSVECSFESNKLLFYFTANGRVDFRALVKDLATIFKTRIELRQIGVRDEARMIGGLGPCGRPICCGAFLKDFQPVSIKMAKEQNLSLNPTKISGVCGRLMCCLKYEQCQYECARKRMPRVGKSILTPDGNGVVAELNMMKDTVTVRFSNGDSFENKVYEMSALEEFFQAQNKPDEAADMRTLKEARLAEITDSSVRSLKQVLQSDKEFSDQTEASKKKQEKTKVTRESNQKNERQYGQPVKREKTSQIQKQNRAINKAESNNQEYSKVEDSRKYSKWSEAVEKAIQDNQ